MPLPICSARNISTPAAPAATATPHSSAPRWAIQLCQRVALAVVVFSIAMFNSPLRACDDEYYYYEWVTGSYDYWDGDYYCMVTQWESEEYTCDDWGCEMTGSDSWEEEDCGYVDPEDPYCEGENPFSVHDGNARREVSELEMPGTSGPRFSWTRYHNTVPRGIGTWAYFGRSGSWRHSWQFELMEVPAQGADDAFLEFISPSGMRRAFRPTANGEWAPLDRFGEQLVTAADGFDVITRGGVRLHFAEVAHPGSARRRFEMRSLTDPHGLVTRLEYNEGHYLTKVTDPAGRFFQLTYRDLPLRLYAARQLAKLDGAAPGADGWVDLPVSADLRQRSNRYLRCQFSAGSTAAIAEVQFFAPGDMQPLPGTALGSAAAFDGNPETAFAATDAGMGVFDLGSAQPVARIRVRPRAGASLAGATINSISSLPDSTRVVLAGVQASDGRSVAYDYEAIPDPVLPYDSSALVQARYGDGTAAHYRYTPSPQADRPMLTEADDPRYKGRAKRIRYAYRADGVGGMGFIHQEINLATGGVYASLELDPADLDKRIVHYSDLRSVSYRTPTETNGRPTERIDALGRKTTYEYAENGIGRLTAKTDRGGHRTEFTYDDHGLTKTEQRANRFEQQTVRDAAGRVQSTTDRHGRKTTYARDANGRVTHFTGRDGGVREFTRDALGRIITFKQRDGGIHHFTYNERGLEISSTDPRGQVTHFGYDAQDRRVSVTDTLGRVTRRELNERGLATKIIHPDGTKEVFVYDDYGRKIATTDHQGRTTKLAYDELGRVTRQEDSVGRVTTFDYTELPQGCGSCTLAPNATRIVGPDGAVTTRLYDTEGRLLAHTVASGTAEAATTLYAYDNDNNVVSITDPLGHVVRFTYDDEGHRLTATDTLGRVTKWDYNEHGNVTSIITPDGGVTHTEYDANDRLIKTTDAAGNVTRRDYDALGNLVSLTDSRGSVYRWIYDGKRKNAMIYPDGSRESWTYDPVGRPITYTTRAGQTKSTSYNIGSRPLTEKWSPSGAAPNIIYTYTALGQIATIDNGLAKLSYTYNSFGLVTAEATTRNGQATLAVGYDYDAAGRRTALSHPDGAIVTSSYTARGQLAALSLGGDLLATYSYDLVGRPVGLARNNGVATAWTYNDAGGLLSIAHATGSGIATSASYELDAVGRRIAKSEADGWTERYAYDATGQLTTAGYFESPAARQTVREVSYTYDANGNRERMTELDRPQRGAARTSVTRYAANVLNQYTSITANGATDVLTYDANGNLIRQGGVDYSFNAKNQLIEVMTSTERMTQIHDPKGRVIERRYFTMDTQGQWVEDEDRSVRHTYDNAWNVIEDRGLNDDLRARYIHGSRMDEILVCERSDGARLYSLADGLGSTIALTDAGGSVKQNFRYDAYGMPRILNTDVSLYAGQLAIQSTFRFLFTGREFLASVELNDHRNRYYLPSIGRWLTIDPIGFADGLNIYAYARNSPTEFIDSTGLACNNTAQCLDDCDNALEMGIIGCSVICLGFPIGYPVCWSVCSGTQTVGWAVCRQGCRYGWW